MLAFLEALLAVLTLLFLSAWLTATVAVLVIATVALWFID